VRRPRRSRRSICSESSGERTRRETEPGLAADRFEQPSSHLADRLAGADHTVEVEPRDAFVSHLDHRREVVERGREELADADDRLFVG